MKIVEQKIISYTHVKQILWARGAARVKMAGARRHVSHAGARATLPN